MTFSLHIQIVRSISAGRLQVDRKCTRPCAHSHTLAVAEVQNLTEESIKGEQSRHNLLCLAFFCPQFLPGLPVAGDPLPARGIMPNSC